MLTVEQLSFSFPGRLRGAKKYKELLFDTIVPLPSTTEQHIARFSANRDVVRVPLGNPCHETGGVTTLEMEVKLKRLRR